MAISHHSGPRGVLGFLLYVLGADGVTRGSVLPAYVQADSAGNEIVFAQAATAIAAAPSFTRPADTTAYASGDLVANSVTAGSVVPLAFAGAARTAAGAGKVKRARVKKSGVSITLSSFRLHLYSATIATIANGDNGVWSTDGAANYLGSLDIVVDKAFTDGAFGVGVPLVGTDIAFKLAAGTSLFGLLEARAAYVPGNAETFVVSLEVAQD